jgi:circadian clock protein KaiC
LFRYFETNGQVHLAMSVMKNRSGAHERTIREIKMSQHGIEIGPPLQGFSGILTGTPTKDE